MNMIWENYLWESPNTDGLDTIKDIEKQLGITFPSDYLEVVKQHQGQTPKSNIFSLKSGFTTGCSTLFHFTEDEYDNSYNILNVYEISRCYIPDKIIPIAESLGDNICFDFREDSTNPKVVLAIHEYSGDEAVKFIANNFTEFLNMLVEDVDE